MAYNKEDSRRLVLLEVENYKKALELYDSIIEVVEKYNGKVLNKRFETALKKVNDYIRVDMSGRTLYIQLYLEDRSVKSFNNDFWIYINKTYINLNGYTPRLAYSWENDLDGKLCADHENRLIASVLIKSLNEEKEHIKNKIILLENEVNKADEYKQQLEDLKAQMEKITRNIPYEIRDYFELNYNVYNNR